MSDDRGPEMAAVLGLFLGLSWLFVLLRVYVKTTMSKSWAPDDTLLMVSLMLYTSYSVCAAIGVRYGTGRHLDNIPHADIPKALRMWWVCELLYTLTTVFIRISIAVFLLRLSAKPIHRYIVHATLLIVCLFSTIYFFILFFQCSPYSHFWRQYEGQHGQCINPVIVPNASIAHSVVSFTADWTFGLLPLALLYDLNLNRRSKFSVAGLLSLGLLAGVAAIVRIPYIRFLAITDDFLYATTDVAIWSTIEPGLGIVAFAGATFRPLFRSFYGLATRQGRSTHSRGSRAIRLGDGKPRADDEFARHECVGLESPEQGGGVRKKSEGRAVVSQSKDYMNEEGVSVGYGYGFHKTVDVVTPSVNQLGSQSDSQRSSQRSSTGMKGVAPTGWNTFPPRRRGDMV